MIQQVLLYPFQYRIIIVQELKIKVDMMNQVRKTDIPSNTQTIIIVLGKGLLPTGQPHQWLTQRVNCAYSLIDKLKLDMKTTAFLVSGSDISNVKNSIKDPLKKHMTEAQMMYRLLVKINEEKTGKNVSKDTQGQFIFSDHVIQERKAISTIDNFYNCLLIILKSKLKYVKDIIIVTSNYHMKRAKLCFEAMFLKQNKTLIEGLQYQNVKFLQAQSSWPSQKLKQQRFSKEDQLCKHDTLKKTLNKKAMILWNEIKEQNMAIINNGS